MGLFEEGYPRDLRGYAGNPPHAQWPNQARIAVQFVLNYEEGAENHVLHGDAGSEQFLSDIIGAASYPDKHMSMDSLYEYGSRAGFWRIHHEFQKRGLPLTVFGVAMALARHPEIVAAIKAADYDVVSHGWRWIHYQNMDINQEREHLHKAVHVLTDLFGKPPAGWYTGRDSPNTRQLVVEHGGFDYDSDYYGDDLPFWTEVACSDGSRKPHLIVPYTLDANDMRFATAQGFNTAEQFYTYLKDSFDVLYEEGESAPKMMSIGMHCRLLGRPGRFRALQRFLDYVQEHERVWVCTRQQIADHWRDVHPLPGPVKLRRRHVPPFHVMINIVPVRNQEVLHLGAELIDQEGATGAQHGMRALRDRRADAGRQGRERKTRQDIVGMVEAMVAHDLLHVRRRSVHRLEARIDDGVAQIIAEIGIGIDRDQHRVGRHPLQDRPAEGADARAIFDEQLGVGPIVGQADPQDARARR